MRLLLVTAKLTVVTGVGMDRAHGRLMVGGGIGGIVMQPNGVAGGKKEMLLAASLIWTTWK